MKKSSFKRSLALFMAILMLVTSVPIMAFATDESGVNPGILKTEGQPFVSNQPSQYYRIPSSVVLDSGTIIAVADARWNAVEKNDGGGNDTIVARSTDNGANWENQLVNYYPDNGNVHNGASTSVCDTEIVTDGVNVWMLTVFFPAGYALSADHANNSLSAGITAFDDQGRVKLFKNGETNQFNYYLGEFNQNGPEGRAPIMANNGTETGYFVDHDYYIYDGTSKRGSNLFYSDGEFQTAKVNFLLLRKSSDDGKTWSDFTPLNLKYDSEKFFGVGPGHGIYDFENDRILFATYSYTSDTNSQRASFIYSEDQGVTWHRTNDFPKIDGLGNSWSSEASLVQLDKKTIRCFVRNAWKKLIYCDATLQDDGTYKWDKSYKEIYNSSNWEKDTLGIPTGNSGCQISVIKYSHKLLYDGKYYTALFVSTPQNVRTNGVIYTLILDENYNLVNANTSVSDSSKQIEYLVKSGTYAYSSILEMPDGTLSLLYESDNGSIEFINNLDVQMLSGCKVEDYPKTYNYSISRNSVKEVVVDKNTGTVSDNSVINVEYKERTAVNANIGNTTAFTGTSVPLREALYTFTKQDNGTWLIGSGGLYITAQNNRYPNQAINTSRAKEYALQIKSEGSSFAFVNTSGKALGIYRSGDSKLSFDLFDSYGTSFGSSADSNKANCTFEIWRPATSAETDSTAVPGYVQVTNLSQIQSGDEYLIGCNIDGDYYFIYPSSSTNNTYSHAVKVNPTPVASGYFMIVTGLREGSAVINNGYNTYIFDVTNYSNEILGVVEYDPVIYTHGGSTIDVSMAHTFVGNKIADATYAGEKETCYRYRTVDGVDLSEKYRIISVTPVQENADMDTVSGSQISLTNADGEIDGRLHGTLSLADNVDYVHYDKGTYVLLKTTLEEIETGDIYTQTDKLYVASNPVAGHVAYAQSSLFTWTSGGAVWANLATFLLAEGSYGNTYATYKDFGVGTGDDFTGNASIMYNEEGVLCYNGSSASGMFTYKKDNQKTAGANDHNRKEKHLTGDAYMSLMFPKGTGTDIAIYYYDKSQTKNEGITKDPNDPSNFSFVIRRQRIDVADDGGGSMSDQVAVDTDDSKDYVNKLSGDGTGTVFENSRPFGTNAFTIGTRKNANTGYTTDGYTTNGITMENTTQLAKSVVKCSTKENGTETLQPNSTHDLRGVLSYYEYAHGDTKRNKINSQTLVPFRVIMCDKSNERNAYNKTIEHVLKSTDYTSSTWTRYMDAVLVYQEYLNNYTLTTTTAQRNSEETYEQALNKSIDNLTTVDDKFNNIQKRATFGILQDALEETNDIYTNGIVFADGSNYTPSSYKNFIENYNKGQILFDEAGKGLYKGEDIGIKNIEFYTPDEIRAEIPGWKGVGPFNNDDADREPIQVDIDAYTNSLLNDQPVLAASDEAYLAVKDLYNRIDKTAYTDNGATISDIFTEYDTPDGYANNKIYLEYNNKLYVDVPANASTEENPIDHAVASALTEMTVATEKANVKRYNVAINANGTAQTVEGVTGLHNYGEIVYIDFSPYFNAETQNIECVVTSYRTNEKGEIVPTTTTANLSYYADKNYIVPILIQNDIEFTVTATDKAVKQATIVDYYGTVIGTLTGETVTVDTATQTVTDGNQTIKAKNSPKYSFTGWSLADDTYPITEGMVISQVGELIPGGCQITAQGGKVNTLDVFNSNQLNLKLTLAANNPNAIWTRTVDGKETLASYEANFVNFSSGADVLYKAYDNIDALPTELRTLAESNTPAINGVGYYANGKFTLSVDYSAPIVRVKDDKGNDTDELVVNVLDAGIIFTTTNPENLYKGGEGTTTYAAPRIAHWSSDSVNAKNSGTFTMSTSKNIDGAYMRAYVSYTLPYGKGTTLPYVAYSDTVYKCVKQADGSYKVTAVN